MGTQGYRELLVWRKAVELTIACYGLAQRLPPTERFALALQLRRAAVSIPANIAEGNGRFTRGSYIQFLRVARGSLAEVETLVELSLRLEYVSAPEAEALRIRAAEVSRLLTLLTKALQR
jgi:four helix bundle protein